MAYALQNGNCANYNCMKTRIARFIKILFSVTVINCLYTTASAQNAIQRSRVSVVSNESKTSIWVSDFPKKTSVVIMDAEYNLISIISTNDYGAAYLSLPSSIKSEVFVKTLNGEIIVSNKPVIKGDTKEQHIVSRVPDHSNKS